MNQNPKDWKTYDEFAYGIDTNRLPATDALGGSTHQVGFDDGRKLELSFGKEDVKWSDGEDSATDKAEVIEVAPKTYFVEIVFAGRPKEAETLILNIETRRALSIYSIVRDAKDAVGEPQVAQIFRPGVIEGGTAGGPVPHESRDLIGLRAHFTYSPNHVYGRWCADRAKVRFRSLMTRTILMFPPLLYSGRISGVQYRSFG